MSNKLHSLGIDKGRQEELLNRIERVTELPLLILAFVMIPLLLGPLLWPLAPEGGIFVALDSFIWAVFALDLTIKVVVAPRKRDYLRRHWLDVLIVVVPFFRPLRLLRLLTYQGAEKLPRARLTPSPKGGFESGGHPQTPDKGALPLWTPLFQQPAMASERFWARAGWST